MVRDATTTTTSERTRFNIINRETGNRVRYELLKHFGYFVTESSEHFAEYVPWFIKRDRPDLIEPALRARADLSRSLSTMRSPWLVGTLETRTSNLAAREFYRARGYQPCGEPVTGFGVTRGGSMILNSAMPASSSFPVRLPVASMSATASTSAITIGAASPASSPSHSAIAQSLRQSSFRFHRIDRLHGPPTDSQPAYIRHLALLI